MIFWHELCWGGMIAVIIIWARKVARSYREGKS
jgi:hypothetical protein